METYKAHETAVIDPGCTIGDGTHIWHFSHIMPGCSIGRNCNIGQNVVISPQVVLGDNVKVQNNVSVSRKDQYLKTYVGKGASIGANATIVCGHTIGEYAMIGAGAVVTKDIPPYALVVGNPSHRIGWVSEYGHRLSFNEKGIATCPESNQQYQLRGDIVTRIS